MPFPGPSSSGNQVLGEHIVPGGLCALITSPVAGAQFLGCAARAPSLMFPVSSLGSRFLAAALLVDVNCPGSQEDLVSSWESAHSLVEDVLSGAEIAAAPCLQALAVSSLLLCLCAGRGRYTAC